MTESSLFWHTKHLRKEREKCFLHKYVFKKRIKASAIKNMSSCRVNVVSSIVKFTSKPVCTVDAYIAIEVKK